MVSKDNLGDRIKSYENVFRQKLPNRMPIICRLDGCHFHSYTKSCKKPVDQNLIDCMNETTIYLCKNIQGCQIAYVQSDEISLLLNNYSSIGTQSWFDNNLQKIVSVSAGMASSVFTNLSPKIFGFHKLAIFDSRAFVLPKEEVCNYFIFRQQDATRNSVQMLARSLYSHKDCNDKNNSELQEMCFQKGFNWNDCSTSQKRGRCIVKKKIIKSGINSNTKETFSVERSEWLVDENIPVFTKDRQYIDKYVF